MKFLRYAYLAIASAAAILAVPASATVITFDNFDTSGPFGGSGKVVTSYTENGFLFTTTSGRFFQYIGGTGGTSSPDTNSLYTGGFGGFPSSTLTVTSVDKSPFRLLSFDALGGATPTDYLVVGYKGEEAVSSYSGTVSPLSGDNTLTTFKNTDVVNVDSISFRARTSNSVYLDNFTFGDAVTPTPVPELPTSAVPEPASWAMMIAGFGLAGTTLRKRKRASLTLA